MWDGYTFYGVFKQFVYARFPAMTEYQRPAPFKSFIQISNNQQTKLHIYDNNYWVMKNEIQIQ